MEAEAFFAEAMSPDFPDEMVFQLYSNNTDPQMTFSRSGVENLADQFHDFMMARIKAKWDKTGMAPKSLFAKVKLTIGDKPLNPDQLELFGPWTNWEDLSPGGLMTIDASMRAELRERK